MTCLWLPVLGFSAIMLRPAETVECARRSASAVLHVIEGEGAADIDEVTLTWDVNDTFAIPTHAVMRLTNRSSKKPVFLFMVDDAPLQRKLGFYEVFR